LQPPTLKSKYLC